MTFTFPRISAGIYEVQKDSNTVGFIRKATTAKWIVVDVVDTPQHVTKTLKDAKTACVELIIFDNDTKDNVESQGVDNCQESEYDTFVEVDKNVTNTKELKGSLKTFRQVPGTGKFQEVCPSEFGFDKNDEDYVYTSFGSGEPTLDPILF